MTDWKDFWKSPKNKTLALHQLLLALVALWLLACEPPGNATGELAAENGEDALNEDPSGKAEALQKKFAKALEDNLPEKAQEALDALNEMGASVEEEDMKRFREVQQELTEAKTRFDKATRAMDLKASRAQLAALEKITGNTAPQAARLQEVETHHIAEAYPNFQNLEYTPQAVQWMEAQVAQGNRFAQANLGFLYCKGIGVPANYGKSFQLLSQAANQNLALAQVFLGQLYVEGKGVTASPRKGFEWVQKAARQGLAIGQFVLAVFYIDGTGVQKSEKEAERWLERAASQGNRMAIARLEQLRNERKQSQKESEKPPPKDNEIVKTVRGVDFTMVKIPAGTFTMGSPEEEAHRIGTQEYQHEVTISRPFWMSNTEVTQALWEAIMDYNPSTFKGPQRPVERVSYDEAQAFTKKLNDELDEDTAFRLPTEAEWEYSCRAGSKGPYAGPPDHFGWYRQNAGNQTQQVGKLQPNAWGLYDMHGNVYEWCLDRWVTYPEGPVTDPRYESGDKLCIYRGGSFQSFSKDLRSAVRNGANPWEKSQYLGFRLAWDGPSTMVAESGEPPPEN